VKNFRIRAYKFSTNAGQKSHGHNETNIIEGDQKGGCFPDFPYKEGVAKDPPISLTGTMGKLFNPTETAKKPKCMMCMILKTVTHFFILIRVILWVCSCINQ